MALGQGHGSVPLLGAVGSACGAESACTRDAARGTCSLCGRGRPGPRAPSGARRLHASTGWFTKEASEPAENFYKS